MTINIDSHADFILEQFAKGETMVEIGNALRKSGVENGFDYDRGYHVRQVLRARGQIAPARKRSEPNRPPVRETGPLQCPHCGKTICPHCGKPI